MIRSINGPRSTSFVTQIGDSFIDGRVVCRGDDFESADAQRFVGASLVGEQG